MAAAPTGGRDDGPGEPKGIFSMFTGRRCFDLGGSLARTGCCWPSYLFGKKQVLLAVSTYVRDARVVVFEGEDNRQGRQDFLTPCLTPKKPPSTDCDAVRLVVEISPSLSFEFARPRASYGHLGPKKRAYQSLNLVVKYRMPSAGILRSTRKQSMSR